MLALFEPDDLHLVEVEVEGEGLGAEARAGEDAGQDAYALLAVDDPGGVWLLPEQQGPDRMAAVDAVEEALRVLGGPLRGLVIRGADLARDHVTQQVLEGRHAGLEERLLGRGARVLVWLRGHRPGLYQSARSENRRPGWCPSAWFRGHVAASRRIT